MRSPLRHSLLAAALLAAGVTSAHAGSLLDLAVVDRDSGQTLPTYSRDGKLYVPGIPGHRYSVRMTNRTGARVLAVLSVDGVNAVTGETANPEQSGYVLDAWESADIAGWRKNLDEIAQFNFTALPDSYAARTGRPGNVGVIGVAVYTEREHYVRPLPSPPISERDDQGYDRRYAETAQAPASANKAEAPREAEARAQAPMPSADSAGSLAGGVVAKRARSEDKLGTGHGAREYSHVDSTQFERASRWPSEKIAVFYDSYANLVARGVIARPVAQRDPNPFPNGFVADPPSR